MEEDRSERDAPEIDVEQLLQKVRQELAATGARSQQMPSVEAQPPVHRLPARMAELSAAISAAEQVSQRPSSTCKTNGSTLCFSTLETVAIPPRLPLC